MPGRLTPEGKEDPGLERPGKASTGRNAPRGCLRGKVLRISWGRYLVELKEHLEEARPALSTLAAAAYPRPHAAGPTVCNYPRL